MSFNPVTADSEERFQVKAAWLYHVEGLTQGAIADHLGVTRLRVNRALQDAMRNGKIRVSIHSRYAPCVALEDQLKKTFGLADASIAPAPADETNIQRIIGAELGRYLSTLLHDPTVELFGIGWGQTLNYAARAVLPGQRPELDIISVMGGLARGSQVNAFEITASLADQLQAQRTYFTAPLFASTAESRNTIIVQDVFQTVLKRIRQADAIAFSAGDVSEHSLLIRDGLPADVSQDEIVAAGAVGDVLGYFIDARGQLIDHPINERIIGVDPQQLRHVGKTILAAGGSHKLAPIRAALRAGLCNVLISDQRTAEALLARAT